MKRLIIFGFFFLFFSAIAYAESRYVNNVMKITLRTGADINHKIVAMVKSGQKVKILKEGEEWSFARLKDGREGWLLNRFLTTKEPDSILLASLQKQYQAISDKVPLVVEENRRVKEENKKFNQELGSTKEAINKLSRSYESLKEESKEFLELKVDYKKILSQLSIQTNKAQKLEKELMSKYITAALCGAGVLLLGFIIGFAAKRQRKRPSLL